MDCHVFGAAALVHETRDLPYAYRNESTSIPTSTGDLFPACGDAVLDARASCQRQRQRQRRDAGFEGAR